MKELNILLVLSLLFLSWSATAQITPDLSKDVRNLWSYGFLDETGTFKRFTLDKRQFEPKTPGATDGIYTYVDDRMKAGLLQNTASAPITTDLTGNYAIAPNEILQKANGNNKSVIRYKSTKERSYKVTVVWTNRATISDNIDVEVVKGTEVLYSKTVTGTDKGAKFDQTIDLKAGEWIEFHMNASSDGVKDPEKHKFDFATINARVKPVLTPVIGQFYEELGGIVFELAPDGKSGRVVTQADVGNDRYYDALEAIDALVLFEKDDWYMPHYNGLDIIYNVLHKNGIGNFATNTVYWNSRCSEGACKLYSFGKNVLPSYIHPRNMGSAPYRAIRNFSLK